MTNIFQGDCFDILKRFKPEEKDKVDLVCVDLPYSQTCLAWDKSIDLKKMWIELKRICKDNCIYVFFCTTKFGYKLIQSNEKWFRYDLVWEKSRKVGFLSANKMPLRKHEMIYVFSNDKNEEYNDLKNSRNLKLRAYFKDILKYTGKTMKEITNKCGRRCEHCFYVDSTQFGIPTEKAYDILVKEYKLRDMEGFKEYKELKDTYEKPPSKPSNTYNPQMTKGKPYKVKGGDKLKDFIYGDTKRRSNINNKGTRHPTSILQYPEERKHEMLYVFKEKQGTYNPQMTKGKPYKAFKTKNNKKIGKVYCGISTHKENKGTRHPTTILQFNNPKKSLHPTQKPINLLEWIIKSYSNEGDLVLDFTMGSGSCGIACLNTERTFFGIEKDNRIYDTAHRRLFLAELRQT